MDNRKIDNILKMVLVKVTPTGKERKAMENILTKVNDAVLFIIKPLGFTHILAGSFVRDTWMPHKKEFDIFILFPESLSREGLEKKGLDIGKKIIKKLKGSYKIAYAEHPYVRGKMTAGKKYFDIDIVPCYKLKTAEKIKSAVDRTPFHNEWLKGRFPMQLSNDVRLLKQFTKNLDLYGSDTKVMGFSGYLCELLIFHFKSFKKLVKEASAWEPGMIFIDIEGYHKNIEIIKKRFKKQPLIVIDPVDRNRNVAAALSPENFALFVKSCKEFIKNPSIEWFFAKPGKTNIKKINEEMKRRETKILLLVFKKSDVIDDVLWPQMRKSSKRLSDILKEYEFQVMGSDVFCNKNCFILLELNVWKLPSVRKLTGPNIFIKNRSQEFIKKYKPLGRLWVENDYWVAEIKRMFTDSESKIKDTLSASFQKLKDKGIPSHVAKSIGKKYTIMSDKDILSLAKKDEEFARFLENYFKKRII